jgi:hypothetical protein
VSTAGDLHVFVACASWAFAVPTSAVDRLIAASDTALRPCDRPGSPAHLGTLPEPPGYSAWDLGALLGLRPESESWILCRVPGASGELRIALRSGVCLSVGSLPQDSLSLLPETMSFVRSGFARAAFATPRRRGGQALSPLGLVLDLSRLFLEEERGVARRDLESAGSTA